jgi:omega-6 fatty acid desaturase (delta-12 desaturase)
MTADLPVRPEITPGYRREADREIRAFTRDWTARDDRIASLSYFGTFAVYFFTLWLAVQAWPVWWLVVPLIVVNAFAGVRLYVLQHDCGHGSLYSSKRANDLAGHGLSVFTLTPYRVMQFNHNEHHSHLGNLEERDTTEIFTMTLREWEEAGSGTRLRYRLYRNPLLMIPVGGLLTYVFVYRWPKNAGRIDAAG